LYAKREEVNIFAKLSSAHAALVAFAAIFAAALSTEATNTANATTVLDFGLLR
jgi:hypothetical protein